MRVGEAERRRLGLFEFQETVVVSDTSQRERFQTLLLKTKMTHLPGTR